jgi:hypothetical protein
MPRAKCGTCQTPVEAPTQEEMEVKIKEHLANHRGETNDINKKILEVIRQMRTKNLIMTWHHKSTNGYIPYGVNGLVLLLKDIMNLTPEQCEMAMDYLDGKHLPPCDFCVETMSTQNLGRGAIGVYCSKCNRKIREEDFAPKKKEEVKSDGPVNQSRLDEDGE